MDVDDPALLAARIQFGLTISFHIVLAAFSIGLANFLMVLEGLWLRTRDELYLDLYKFWLKIFALNVTVGVVSGIVMEFEFGTNWGRLATLAGAVIGPLMFYEVLVAFFLEAGFLGIMLFGMRKVGPKLHFFTTCMVALGSLFSAFWILSANSWMHTPAGFVIGPDGRFEAQDWLAIIFNPSFPYRFTHMTLAAFLATALMVAATGAWHLLRDRGNRGARVMFSMALWVIAVLAPLQILVGDLHGENTLEHQPQKVAAIEGAWDRPPPGQGEPMRLFAIPDMQARRNHFELAIPNVGSLYLRHNLSGTIRSLNEFPPEDIPPVPIVFFAFRIMVGLGLLMAGVGAASLVLRWRGRLYEARWLQRVSVWMAPAGFVAMLCGWVVTEVGRQPFTVYGLLRTADSRSPVSLSFVTSSTLSILAVYLLVFGLGLAYLLRALRRPPEQGEREPEPGLRSPPVE
ncbi:cytochrome ubiquinol oxidase subunit I [Stutzerimonas nosocomialis]|uniref:Cytochrome ubiquinol oxidase subunit I n=1 Tax=Stutzerimonas nosocomialis TaxID=1056496 RepID=A0A5R9QEC1_9GAMM|nr:cytochrome ubiquinol oxidase subunit I [Stutzerimonas nosocomialis]TLX63487.1 cytochrome ubiquinol oxidase subunit I [Stutzerimonas nosocomialis]